jgi:Carboxypeptidase regulatory-like domain
MKTRRIITICLALVLCGSFSFGQESSEKWLLVEVTNTDGQPLKQACVTFVPREGEIIFRNADSRGRVKLKRPDAARYRVVVKVDGYEAQKREVTIGSKSETVAFTLQPRVNR